MGHRSTECEESTFYPRTVGSDGRGCESRRCKRIRRMGPRWQWLGVDLLLVQTATWLGAIPVLPRLLSKLFRRETFRYEGRLAPYRCMHVKAVIPELVSTAFPARLRHISMRGGIIGANLTLDAEMIV